MGDNWTGGQLPTWVTFKVTSQASGTCDLDLQGHLFFGGGGAADHIPSAHIFEDALH